MPRQIDQSEQSDQPSTLPPPELNPLLNPLLAQNMGRWAEVYFTSAPEKREQAVAELVRELGGEVGRQEEEMPAAADGTAAPSNSDRIAQSAQDQCRSCGHENPRSQRFCGMCGVVLRGVALPDVSQNIPQHVPQPDIAPLRNAQPEKPVAAGHLDELRFLPPEDLVDDRASEPSPEQEPASANEYSWVEKYRDQSHDQQFSFESTQPSFAYTYRVFIGGVLAAVMLVVGYMAWRNEQAASGLSQQTPAVNASQPAGAPGATQSEATQSDATPAGASPSDSASRSAERSAGSSAKTSDNSSARNDPFAGTDGHANANPVTEETKAKTMPSGFTQAERRAVAPPPNGADPFTPRVGNGSEELALAQRYLSGSGGQQRDPSQAAQWLWKAVAKQNADAIVLLSDLYLKGDGIAKNCDQARVLLDAAARRGRTDAGERLRNLPAFGCQ